MMYRTTCMPSRLLSLCNRPSYSRTIEHHETRKHRYIDLLTMCRGLAAVLVVISHCVRASEHQDSPESVSWFIRIFDIGSFAVVVFLALSGVSLCLSSAYLKGQVIALQPRKLVEFYVKRVCRIWPAFFVSLLAYLVFREIFRTYHNEISGHWIEAQFLAEYTMVDLLSYLLLVNNFLGTPELFNNAYWSLPIEFQYYIFFPFFILALKSCGIRVLVLIGASIFLLRYCVPENYTLLFTLAPAFVGGIIAAHIYRVSSIRIPLKASILLCTAIIALASCLTHVWHDELPIPILGELWVQYVLLSVLTVFLLLIAVGEVAALPRKVLHFLGEISFSVYLFHNLFVGIIYLLLSDHTGLPGTQRFFVIFPFTLLCTLAISTLVYRYVEKPFIALGSRYTFRT